MQKIWFVGVNGNEAMYNQNPYFTQNAVILCFWDVMILQEIRCNLMWFQFHICFYGSKQINGRSLYSLLVMERNRLMARSILPPGYGEKQINGWSLFSLLAMERNRFMGGVYSPSWLWRNPINGRNMFSLLAMETSGLFIRWREDEYSDTFCRVLSSCVVVTSLCEMLQISLQF